MIHYYIRVFDDHGDHFREYDISTSLGDTAARTFAFLMDGGCGTEYTDDMEELAKTYTEIVSKVHE